MSQWGRNGILGDDWGPMGEEKEGRDLGVPHSTWQPLFGSGAGCACADLMPWGSRSLLVSLEGWFILVSLSPPHPPSLNQTSSCSSKSASSCLLAGNGAVSEHGNMVQLSPVLGGCSSIPARNSAASCGRDRVGTAGCASVTGSADLCPALGFLTVCRASSFSCCVSTCPLSTPNPHLFFFFVPRPPLIALKLDQQV